MTLTTFLRVIERSNLPWEFNQKGAIRCPVRWGADRDDLSPLTWVALRCKGRYVPLAQASYLKEALDIDPKLLSRLWEACENQPMSRGIRRQLVTACRLEGV